ncbi:MAG: NAD(P)-dependent alcohol dehydrogenase [Hyphomonadaceae bacterium]
MQILQLDGAYGVENLQCAERPTPTPGPGEITVRMKAISINFRDLAAVDGAIPHIKPLIPFSDGAGIVEAVGPGVTRVAVGDRVASVFFSDGWIGGPVSAEKKSKALGGLSAGCAQEIALLPAGAVSHFPEHMSFEEAACLPCAALTAWNAVVSAGDLLPGDTALFQGTGGVSIFALQIAKMMGLRAIITSSSDEKLERCAALGADHCVNYVKTPEWGPAAKALTPPGVDLVVEVGGAGTLPQSLKAVRVGGRIAIVGVVSGQHEIPASIVGQIMMGTVRMHGISVGSREMYEAMMRAFAQHRLKPVIDKIFPWEEAAAGLRYVKGGAHFGKVVLTF